MRSSPTANAGARLLPVGGSDFVMVFEAASGVELESEPQRHRMKGERAGFCRR